MIIKPPNGWTHGEMSNVQMSKLVLFYFTEHCQDCGLDALLSLELDQGDIRFRCSRCEAEVDHDRVVACDEAGLNEYGWVIRRAE